MDFPSDSILQSHMCEGNWKVARRDKPVRLIKRPLGIGRLADPPTFLFQLQPGPATLATLVSLEGDRFRMVVAEGDPKDQVEQILGTPEVDCSVDAVGFEAHGHGDQAQQEAPATVLNSLMDLTRAGGALGIPGLYVTGDPGAADDAAKQGSLSLRLGLGWAKSHAFFTGQCPVMKYNRQLMMAILGDRVQIAKNVNATVISLDDAPRGYEEFDKGAARKYILNPNDLIPA